MKRLFNILLLLSLFFINTSFVLADNLDCSKTLKRGSKGTDVVVLQEKLNQYIGCGLTVDGAFGTKTYACVAKFQDRYNLNVDGVVGVNTCKKLNSDLKKIYEVKLKVASNKNIVVTSKSSRILSNVNKSNSIIKKVKQGDVLTYNRVVKKNNVNWYKVNVNGRIGYIKATDVTHNIILVDISEQRLVYLKNGKVILNTNVVTGMKGSHDTPIGKYTLTYMERGRTLRGYNDDGSRYASYVDYWMRFIDTRGIGFHDASWRDSSEFNDSTYLYNGSHGCVNMQKNDAKKLYNNLKINTVVIVRK